MTLSFLTPEKVVILPVLEATKPAYFTVLQMQKGGCLSSSPCSSFWIVLDWMMHLINVRLRFASANALYTCLKSLCVPYHSHSQQGPYNLQQLTYPPCRSDIYELERQCPEEPASIVIIGQIDGGRQTNGKSAHGKTSGQGYKGQKAASRFLATDWRLVYNSYYICCTWQPVPQNTLQPDLQNLLASCCSRA